nr:response regulator [Nocardioides daedukensis]
MARRTPHPAHPLPRERHQEHPVKILIADDSRVMRQIVIRTLRQAGHGGHEIVEAENGADAFSKIAETSPDLVLSDWNMPEMNGIDLLAQLRASGSPVPFGFVTSEGSAEMRQRAESGGALFLIAKPFTPEAFDEALRSTGLV